MAVEIQSKKAIVSKAPYELYMGFVDMRNFVRFLPEEKRQGVEADYDTINKLSCKVYRIVKVVPFNDKDLSTIQTIIKPIKD